MRILDPENRDMPQVLIYLSALEARKMVDELSKLLDDPEAHEHFHLFSEDGGPELSCSIVTAAKLAGSRYTAEERQAFGNWKPRSR